MDIWTLYQSKAEDLRTRRREQHLRDCLSDAETCQTWRQRTAFSSGLVLLRLARRLIRYGKPALESASQPLPAARSPR